MRLNPTMKLGRVPRRVSLILCATLLRIWGCGLITRGCRLRHPCATRRFLVPASHFSVVWRPGLTVPQRPPTAAAVCLYLLSVRRRRPHLQWTSHLLNADFLADVGPWSERPLARHPCCFSLSRQSLQIFGSYLHLSQQRAEPLPYCVSNPSSEPWSAVSLAGLGPKMSPIHLNCHRQSVSISDRKR